MKRELQSDTDYVLPGSLSDAVDTSSDIRIPYVYWPTVMVCATCGTRYNGLVCPNWKREGTK